MKIAYCDCFSGISGDMFLGALVGLGLPRDVLSGQVGSLGFEERVGVRAETVRKGALRATQITVDVEMAHDHDHDHDHDHHHPHHRHLSDIVGLFERSALSAKARAVSLDIFRALAEAEARVHGTGIEEVHFHEVGAVDSIVDIAGAAIGLEYLGVERLYASALPMGSGSVETQHGRLPLPAPATLELMQRARAPVVPSPAAVELVTPTGAAILAALATFEQPALSLLGAGTGAGQRDLPWPNVLRLIVGDTETGLTASGDVVTIETNVDDMSPQALGHVMGRLLAAGALDVYFTPIQMKKNRPATMLSAVARRADEAALVRIVLRETSTLGARVRAVDRRYEAAREMRVVSTEFGEVPVKLKIVDGAVTQAAPEYDACARLAAERGVPLMQVYTAAVVAAQPLVSPPGG